MSSLREKIFLIVVSALLFVGAGDPCLLTSPPQIFMEIDPVAANATLTQAELRAQVATSVSLEIVNGASTSFVFDDDSNPNNTSVSFSGLGFCPSAIDLDDLLLLLENANTATGVDAVMTLRFSRMVEDPIFHIDNLDRSAWDFSPTTTDLSLLSSNAEAVLVDGVLLDVDPTTAGGPLSADASVQVNGRFDVIVVHLREILDGGNDSFGLQISVDQNSLVNVAVPTLSHGGYALFALLIVVGGLRRLQTLIECRPTHEGQ